MGRGGGFYDVSLTEGGKCIGFLLCYFLCCKSTCAPFFIAHPQSLFSEHTTKATFSGNKRP